MKGFSGRFHKVDEEQRVIINNSKLRNLQTEWIWGWRSGVLFLDM